MQIAIIKCPSEINLYKMGPSMSNPETFKKRNTQKHYQGYLRKFKTLQSGDTKIKFNAMSDIGTNTKIELLNHRTIPLSTQKAVKFVPPTRIQPAIQKVEKLFQNNLAVTDNLDAYHHQSHQTKIKEEQNTRIYQSPKAINRLQQNEHRNGMNSDFKQSSIKKIVLNNQSYSIDLQKLKNRRLKSREKYNNSTPQKFKNGSNFNAFQSKPETSTNSNLNGVSSLQLQFQLQSKIQLNYLEASLHQHVNRTKDLQNRKFPQKIKDLNGQANKNDSADRNIQANQNLPSCTINEEYFKGAQMIQKSNGQKQLMERVRSQNKFLRVKKSPQVQQFIRTKQIISEYSIGSYKLVKEKESVYSEVSSNENQKQDRKSRHPMPSGQKNIRFLKLNVNG